MSRQRIDELGILLVTVLIAVGFSLTGPGKLLGYKLYDVFSLAKPKPPEWNKILYVDIDDQAIDTVGVFPWPRTIEAKGISVLKEFGADKIILDIEFIDPAQTIVDQGAYQFYKENIDYYHKKPTEYDSLFIEPDRILAAAVASEPQNLYMSCKGVDQTDKKRTDISKDDFQVLSYIQDRYLIPTTNYALTNYLRTYKYMEFPVFPVYLGAKKLGSTFAPKNSDGSLRTIPLFTIYDPMLVGGTNLIVNGKRPPIYLVPQLSLPAIMDDMGVDTSKIEIKPGSYVKMITSNGQTIRVPITKKGDLYMNWSKAWLDSPFGVLKTVSDRSKKMAHLSFGALIEYYDTKQLLLTDLEYLKHPESLSPEDKILLPKEIENLQNKITVLSNDISVVRGKITVTGSTGDASTDRGSITIDPNAPLALVQGNIINMIYQKAFIYPVSVWFNVLILIGVCFLFFAASIRINSALREVSISGVLLVFIIIFLYLAIALFGLAFDYIMILVGAVISLIAFTAYKFVVYDQQKNYIKKAFMQYLSPEVVKEVIEDPSLLKLGGERREITAFFSDVAGFTSISEKLSPEEIVSLLNKYLTAMTDIILSQGGTVDKYEGDAIVAFFGAPIPHPDHAYRCCAASVEMQKSLSALRKQWVAEGFPEVHVRMGLNTGDAIIGNMGSQQRMDYTMMGDTVNSASRFEGANKAYGSQVMISESTYEYVKDKFITRKLDMLRVVGKSKPIAVFELMDKAGEAPEETIELVKRYNSALEEYNNRDWKKAAKDFETLAAETKDPVSKTYAERCRKFVKDPPPVEWDGVYVLKSK